LFKEPDTLLVGLGVGTTKISVIMAERDPRSREAVQIIGIGSAPSQGIRKGLIVNLDQAVRSVREALRSAENIVGSELSEAMVSFSAVDVASVMTSGMVSIGRPPRPIRVDDVNRVIEAAQSELSIPEDKMPLHTIPVRYSIDGNFGIDDPLGMTGMRLEMELQTITVPMTQVHNMVNCVRTAGIAAGGLVIKPLSASLGALTDDEARAGAISLSMGGGTTGLAFYREGRPIKIGVVPIGGDHITNDLAHVLGLNLKRAEELKKRIFIDGDDDFSVYETKKQAGKVIDPNVALEVIGCRLEELFSEYVLPMIPDHEPKQFPGGIVLSGGVAKTPGIDALLSNIFKMPVRVAEPTEYCQMPPGRGDTSYVNAVGTIRYILTKERNPYKFIDSPLLRVGGTRPTPKPSAPTTSLRARMRRIAEKVKDSITDLF
jgi:cell division protein FtsA